MMTCTNDEPKGATNVTNPLPWRRLTALLAALLALAVLAGCVRAPWRYDPLDFNGRFLVSDPILHDDGTVYFLGEDDDFDLPYYGFVYAASVSTGAVRIDLGYPPCEETVGVTALFAVGQDLGVVFGCGTLFEQRAAVFDVSGNLVRDLFAVRTTEVHNIDWDPVRDRGVGSSPDCASGLVVMHVETGDRCLGGPPRAGRPLAERRPSGHHLAIVTDGRIRVTGI